MLAGLLDIPEGGCIAMLPSNSKLHKQHAPWIEQLAQWAMQLAPPPQRVPRFFSIFPVFLASRR